MTDPIMVGEGSPGHDSRAAVPSGSGGNDLESYEASDELVRTRTPALLRSAYLLTGDQRLPEDLVQSALARTHRAWRRLHRNGNVSEVYTTRAETTHRYHVATRQDDLYAYLLLDTDSQHRAVEIATAAAERLCQATPGC